MIIVSFALAFMFCGLTGQYWVAINRYTLTLQQRFIMGLLFHSCFIIGGATLWLTYLVICASM